MQTRTLIALRPIASMQFGNIAKGDRFEVPVSRAAQLIADGSAVPFEHKLPLEKANEEKKPEVALNSSASPAAQALPKQTVSESKRGRSKKRIDE